MNPLPSVPILMYHQISGPRAAGADARNADPHYTVTAPSFAAQMTALLERGFSPVPLDALLPGSAPIHVAKPVVITFDDGYLSDCSIAREVLDRLGWRSEHFVTTDWIGRPGFMTWQHLR